MINIVEQRKHSFVSRGERRSFNFVVTGTTPPKDYDHASFWSFQDEQEVRDRHWHPVPGETVLDIGAAFGSYALPALAMGARVICFSPADLDTEILRANLKVNPDLARRCLVSRDGLYSRNGWFQPDVCRFVSDAEYQTGAAAGPGWLQVRSLDSFLSNRPGIERIDWIKMDVEGAELAVLQGASSTLREERPRLLIELHEFHDKDMGAKVHAFLTGLNVGYQTEGKVAHCAVSHVFYEARK